MSDFLQPWKKRPWLTSDIQQKERSSKCQNCQHVTQKDVNGYPIKCKPYQDKYKKQNVCSCKVLISSIIKLTVNDCPLGLWNKIDRKATTINQDQSVS